MRGAPGLRGRGPGRGQGRSRGAGWISRPRPPGLLEVGSLSSLGSGGAEREAQRILPAGSAVSAGISGEVRPVSPAPPRPKALSTPARLEGTAAEMEMGSGAPDGNGPTTLGFCGSDPQRCRGVGDAAPSSGFVTTPSKLPPLSRAVETNTPQPFQVLPYPPDPSGSSPVPLHRLCSCSRSPFPFNSPQGC